ncbi:MAG: hypothetical protein ACC656_14940, partial [Candidatus Heimdallarchaeota archaeon]
ILYNLLRKFEFERTATVQEVIEAFNQFYDQFQSSPPDYTIDYQRTLKDKPWLTCECIICKEIGMDVIIFRGNNRNRRRGFHNTFVFYKLLSRIRNDPDFKLDALKENNLTKRHTQLKEDSTESVVESIVRNPLDEFFH